MACIRRRTGAPCGFLYILSGYYHLKILIKTLFEIRGMKVFVWMKSFEAFKKRKNVSKLFLKGKFDQRRKFISLIGGNSKSGSGNALSRELHKCKSLLFLLGYLDFFELLGQEYKIWKFWMTWFSSINCPRKEKHLWIKLHLMTSVLFFKPRSWSITVLKTGRKAE